MQNARTASAIMLRLPDDLKVWLKHQAVDNRRSLNGEVLIRLEQSRAQEQQPQGAQQ